MIHNHLPEISDFSESYTHHTKDGWIVNFHTGQAPMKKLNYFISTKGDIKKLDHVRLSQSHYHTQGYKEKQKILYFVNGFMSTPSNYYLYINKNYELVDNINHDLVTLLNPVHNRRCSAVNWNHEFDNRQLNGIPEKDLLSRFILTQNNIKQSAVIVFDSLDEYRIFEMEKPIKGTFSVDGSSLLVVQKFGFTVLDV